MAATTLVALDQLRATAADVLWPAAPGDPYVFADVVDSLEPPALVVDQGDPWLTPGQQQVQTFGPCLYTARVQIVCIAGRLEPGAGVDVLETLETYVLQRMRADTYDWPLEQVSGRGQYDLAGVTYLAATITYLVPTTT